MICNNRRAFSLIEVLIVLAILGLLASLTLPVVKGNQDRAKYEVSILNIQEVGKAMEKHYLEKGKYPVFANWDEVSAENSPLLEYITEIPKGDGWDRKYIVKTSTEEGYEFEGFGIKGSKPDPDHPDYTLVTGPKLKKKGKK